MCSEHKNCYIQILPQSKDDSYYAFYLYLPAGNGYYAQYRFFHLRKPADPNLTFTDKANNQANSDFYRVRTAYIGTLEGQFFNPCFRALQEGEISFAVREMGGADFSGGIHGDEILQKVVLAADGVPLPLDQPAFLCFQCLTFDETSYIYRCNTPDHKLIYHTQRYTASGNTLSLHQKIEWIADPMPLQAAYSPMLTAQRMDPDRPGEVLTDTVIFYDKPEGQVLAAIDTTWHGTAPKEGVSNKAYPPAPAMAAKVYGKKTGFAAEVGFFPVNDSIPREQISNLLWLRYDKDLDSKVYFNISTGVEPKAGTVWESDIYYRLTYEPQA